MLTKKIWLDWALFVWCSRTVQDAKTGSGIGGNPKNNFNKTGTLTRLVTGCGWCVCWFYLYVHVFGRCFPIHLPPFFIFQNIQHKRRIFCIHLTWRQFSFFLFFCFFFCHDTSYHHKPNLNFAAMSGDKSLAIQCNDSDWKPKHKTSA